jgi:hypothetical protein
MIFYHILCSLTIWCLCDSQQKQIVMNLNEKSANPRRNLVPKSAICRSVTRVTASGLCSKKHLITKYAHLLDILQRRKVGMRPVLCAYGGARRRLRLRAVGVGRLRLRAVGVGGRGEGGPQQQRDSPASPYFPRLTHLRHQLRLRGRPGAGRAAARFAADGQADGAKGGGGGLRRAGSSAAPTPPSSALCGPPSGSRLRPVAGAQQGCGAREAPAPTTPCSVICEQLSGNRLRLAVGAGCWRVPPALHLQHSLDNPSTARSGCPHSSAAID